MSPRQNHRLSLYALLMIALLVVPPSLAGAQPSATPAASTTADRDDSTAVLYVFITDRGPKHTGPVDDATVVVYEPTRDRDGRHAQPVARGTTDDGWVRFELPTGPYGIRATDGDLTGHTKVRLVDDRRVHLQLSEPQQDRGHGPYHLGLAAAVITEDGLRPLADAPVVLERLERSTNAAANGSPEASTTWEPILRGATDGDGHLTQTLGPGIYKVTLTTPEDDQAVTRFKLDQDRWIRLHIDRAGESDASDNDRPAHDRPAHDRPAHDGASWPDPTTTRPHDAQDRPSSSGEPGHDAILDQLTKLRRLLGSLLG